MRTSAGRDAAAHGTPGPDGGRPLPFWVLQLAELLAAVVLVDVSVRVRGGASLVAAAVCFAVLAALARGPLGLVRVCPQRLHVALAVTVAALAAASPVVPALRPDVEGIIVLEFAAVGIIRVATLTRTSEQRSSSPTPRRSVIDASASVVDRPGQERPAPSGPASGGDGVSPARRAGRAAGAAAASGRRLVDAHGPAAEARLKRSVRAAGRWAGRVTSKAGDGRPPRT